MANANAIASIKPQDGSALPVSELMERIIAAGDISQLSSADRAHYLVRVCDSIGLNPLSRPFDLIPGPGGSLKLYANKSATDQLRKMYHLRATTRSATVVNDIYIVEIEVNRGHRAEANIGAVSIKGLQGEALANAMMKAHTKAKRRATLDFVGLGFLDPEIPRDYEPYDPFADDGDEEDGAREAEHRPGQRPTPISGGVVTTNEAGEPTGVIRVRESVNPEPVAGATDNAPLSPLEQSRRDVWAQAKGLGYSWDAFNMLRRQMQISRPLDTMTASQVRMLREKLDEIHAQDAAAEGSQEDAALDAEHVVWDAEQFDDAVAINR